MAIVAALAVIVSACSSKPTAPVVRTEIIRPVLPALVRQPCARPVDLLDRDLTQAEVTAGWGADRASLRACEARRKAAVDAVDGGRDGR